jgi:hypothetical protein
MDDSDLSPGALKMLDAFCHDCHRPVLGGIDGANYEMWHAFIVLAHLDGAPVLDLTELLQKRWPHSAEDLAVRMGADYIEKRRLLQSYDRVLAHRERS